MKISPCQNFETEIFSKIGKKLRKGTSDFNYLADFYLTFSLEPSGIKGKRGKWIFEIVYFCLNLANFEVESVWF